MGDNVYDCFIIGGGPASLSAALYASRACLKTAFIEKYLPGGKLNKTQFIENYPGYLGNDGPKLAEDLLKQILDNGVNQLYGEVVSLNRVDDIWKIRDSGGREYESRAVIIASGMRERTLDLPHVDEYYGRGISYCAICDGNLYKGKRVLVIGGGNSAVEEGIYLSEIVSEVQLIHRRYEFRAEEILVKKMRSIDNIKINVPFVLKEIKVDGEKVVGAIISNVETGELVHMDCECIFIYIGLLPENSFLGDLNIEKDELGFVVVDGNMATSIESLYAAGDVTSKGLRQVVTAVNDGAIAAISVKNYLNNVQ